MMRARRGIASGIRGIIKIPKAEEVRLGASEPPEHPVANLPSRALDFPDAKLVDLAGQLLVNPELSVVTAQPIDVPVLDGSEAAGVRIGSDQHAVQEKLHAARAAAEGDVKPFIGAEDVQHQKELPVRHNARSEVRWRARSYVRCLAECSATSRGYPHIRPSSTEIKKWA